MRSLILGLGTLARSPLPRVDTTEGTSYSYSPVGRFGLESVSSMPFEITSVLCIGIDAADPIVKPHVKNIGFWSEGTVSVSDLPISKNTKTQSEPSERSKTEDRKPHLTTRGIESTST